MLTTSTIIRGGEEIVYTVLIGGDGDTWWKAVGNELGGLSNVIDNRVRAKMQYNLSERRK